MACDGFDVQTVAWNPYEINVVGVQTCYCACEMSGLEQQFPRTMPCWR